MSTNYFLVMYNPPWAGPVAYPVNGITQDFFNGHKIAGVNPQASYVLRVDKQAQTETEFPPLDYFTCSDMTVFFSERLIKCLQESGVENVEYYDVDMTYEPTGKKYSCKAANVLGIVKAMDETNSQYDVICDDIVSDVSKLVIDESAVMGVKLVRFFEFTTLLIISADVKEKLEALGVTGMYFVSPEDWDSSML